MSFDQAFPETGRDGRMALAKAMMRFLPVVAADARSEKARDAHPWASMAEIARFIAADPAELTGAEIERDAARAMGAFAARMAEIGGDRLTEWTQILVMCRRIGDAR